MLDMLDLGQPKNASASIWRYMDFTKFVSLLDTRELFFPRSDRLDDPFEGWLPKKSLEALKKVAPRAYQAADLAAFMKKVMEFTFVNSWYRSKYESAAMWTLYLKSKEGIAIRSSIRRLKECLSRMPRHMYIGKVKYIDYETRSVPVSLIHPFFCKRMSYRHEREFRVVIQELPKRGLHPRSKSRGDEGLHIPVDLDRLIREVRLAPGTPDWQKDLAKSVLRKYELKKPISVSDLDEKPVH